MSQPSAEVIFKFGTDAAGMLQAVNQLTGEVLKLGKAEDELKKKIEAAKQATLERLAVAKEMKSFNDSVAAHEAGPAPAALSPRQQAEKIVEARRAAKLVQDEVDRLDPKKVEAPLTPRQQAMKNLEAKRFADAVKLEMERLSPSAPAKTHVESVRESALKAMDQARELRAAGLNGSGVTIREQIEQASIARQQSKTLNAATVRHELLGGEGFGVAARRLMGLGGVAVGVGAAALGVVGGYAERMNQINDRPWITQREREYQSREAVPVLGWAARQGRLIAYNRAGLPGAQAAARRVEFEGEVLQRQMMEERQVGFDRSGTQRELNASVAGANARQAQVLRRVDLGTVAGERQRREEMMMMPSRLQADEAKGAMVAAKAEMTAIDAQRRTLKAEIGRAEEKVKSLERAFNRVDRDRGDVTSVGHEFMQERERLVGLQNEDKALALKRQDAEQRGIKAEAQFDSATSGAAYLRDRKETLGDRVSRAASRDTALGMAGPEQRMMAEQALRMLRQGRFEDMPSELKQAAAQHFPEEVRKMAESAGGRLREGGYGRGLEEYKYGLRESRDQYDRVQEAESKATKQERETEAASLADAFARDRSEFVKAVIAAIRSMNNGRYIDQIYQSSPTGR